MAQPKKPSLVNLHVGNRREWRTWLSEHHASSPGIWLLFYKAHTGMKSIPYEEMVREALCFGWIDSLVKRLDEDRYARKVTPRQRSSKWSDINRKRWTELESAGLLAAAGVAAAPTSRTYAPRPVIPVLPGYIARALKRNAKAWKFFRALAPTHRRDFVVWIHTAKRPESLSIRFNGRRRYRRAACAVRSREAPPDRHPRPWPAARRGSPAKEVW